MAEDSNASLEDFLFLEAKERCYEIEIKGLKEFEKEKARIVQKGRENVNEEIEKVAKNYETKMRIEKSAMINKARLQKMEARNEVIMRIYDDAEIQLARKIVSDKDYYTKVLKKLLVQAFIKLMEHKVYIKCLERDVDLIKELLPGCVEEYKDLLKKECETDWLIEADIVEGDYLEYRDVDHLHRVHSFEAGGSKRINKNQEDVKCFGGILAMNSEKSIVCKNTLDIRLDLCYQESLPDIRQILFPEPMKKVITPAPVKTHH